MGVAFKYLVLFWILQILGYVSQRPLIGEDLWMVRGMCVIIAAIDEILSRRNPS